MSSDLKSRIEAAVKDAMRARDKQRLGVLRMMMAELKRVEVDERVELDDQRVLAILDRMTKQRRDSLAQFEAAGREDLVSQESFELDLISTFMPARLTDSELESLVRTALKESGAESIRDMGKVMGYLKPHVQGRADMGQLGQMVKEHLNRRSG